MNAATAAPVAEKSQQNVTDTGLAALCAIAPAPGPWSFDADASLIRDVNGYVVAQVDYLGYDTRTADNSGRLLAAAPDLLAALKSAHRCLAWHEARHGVAMDRLSVAAAAAAIAKAEGRTS